MTIFFFFPAQVILSIRILQLWVIDTYIICLIMIVIIKITLWIFFLLIDITSEKSWMERWLREYLFFPSNRIKTNTVSLYDKSHLADQRSNYHSWYPNHVSILAQYKFQFVPINFADFLFHSCFPCFRCRNTVWKET